MTEKIHIIHTNDLHSHFENYPRIERFVKEQRHLDQQTGWQTLLFDLGDAADRAHPLTEATHAQANIRWLNKLHYDGVTIGNSEGLYFDHQTLETMYNQANFDVILGNLYETNGQLPHFAQPYKIITTKQHTKIGILGLTAPYLLTYPLMNWDIKLVQQVLPQLIAQVAPQVDVLILLSHLGLSTDRYLCQKYPQLNIIIGSHTHHLLINGELDQQTFLAAAEKYGHYIGNIYFTLEDHQIQQISAHPTLTANLPVLPTDQQVITNYARKGHRLLQQQKIAFLPHRYTATGLGAHSSIQLTLTAMEQATQTTAAMISSGLFLTDLSQGILTADDLHEQLPHSIHLMKTKLKGQELWRFVMEVEKNRGFLRNFHQKGMGFRGKIFGDIYFDGIQVQPGTRQVFYQHQELIPEKTYEIALLDHYLFIPFFPTLQIMGDNQIIYPDFLRTVVAKYLARKYPLKKE